MIQKTEISLLCINAYRLTAIHIYIWIELVLKISTSLLSSRIFSIRLQSNFQHLSQFVICLRKHLIIICVGEERLIWKFTNFFTTEIKLLFSHFSLKFNQFIQKKKKKTKKEREKSKVLPLLESHNSNHSAPEWDFPFLPKIGGLKLLNTLLHPIRTSLLPLLRRSVENCGNWVWKRDDGESLYRVGTFFLSDTVGAPYFIKVTLTSCWVINNIFLFILEIRILEPKI